MAPPFSQRLVAVTGSLRGFVFENPLARVERGLFWSLEVGFAPLTVRDPQDGDEEEFTCSARCEWLRLPVRDWRALEGTVVDADEEDEVDASFYTFEHSTSRRTRLEIGERRGATFQVSLDLQVDFPGFWGHDADPSLPVRADLRVPFEGIDVSFGIVPAVPGRAADASRAAAPFVDLEALHEPRIVTNEFGVACYGLLPRLDR